jgi:hypothetical protein
MSGSQQLLLAAVQQAVATDPDFEYTTLLLPGNGTNGAQNNTFLDSSTNNFTITRNGNTTQGTFSPFSQTGWSNFFDGSGDYLSVARDNVFLPGANTDFTIEAWVYLTATPGATDAQILGFGEYGLNSDYVFAINSSRELFFYFSSSNTVCANTTTLVPLNAWTYVAVSRSGTGSNNLKVFVNGNAASFSVNSTLVGTGGNNLTIGADANGDESNLTGYITNIRFINGTGYTSLTVPTAPLTAITNTQLLTCQSNRFVDNSSNAFAITRNGDVSVQAFSPFNPTAAWSAATYGGSGYFDGSGDYLTVPDDADFDFGSGEFTVEAFFYPTSTGDRVIVSAWSSPDANSAWEIIYFSGTLYCQVASSSTVTTLTTSSYPLNQWNHIAMVRTGNTLSAYLNGTRFATTAYSSTINNGNNGPSIGARAGGSSFPYLGFLSDVRVIKGAGPYDATQTTLTIPTAPLTAITNTQLLTNFTNAGIYDATSKNDLETVGNAQISTTQSKFGGSSMYFDGTGDYVASASSPLLALGTGNLTVEFWFRANSVGTNQRIVQNTVGGFDSTSYILRINGSSKLEVAFAYPDVSASSTTTIANDTWYHVAMVRNGTSVKVYLNGVEEMSGTSSGNMSNQYAYVGGYYNVGPAEYFTGYVQDVRITKGIARYTTAFTPPTTAFPLF